MKRSALLLTACLTLSGCLVEEDPHVMTVLGNQSVTTAEKCVVKAAAGTLMLLPIGTLDLLFTQTYDLFPLVQNELYALEQATTLGAEQFQTEAHYINVTGAWVSFEIDGLLGQYTDGSETELPQDFFVGTSGAVQPQGSIPVKLEVVPPPVGQLLDRDKAFDKEYSLGWMQVKIVLQGYMGDETEVRSQPFYYPIRVCRKCLEYMVPTAEEVEEIQACHPGQDYGVPNVWARFFITPGSDRYEKKIAMADGRLDDLSKEIPAEVLPGE
jgi:hypothetical protein